MTAGPEPPAVAAYRVFSRDRDGGDGGNLAGVLLSERWPDDMRCRAREWALPTVAFARFATPRVIDTRLFTVDGELASCGHASAAVAVEASRTGVSSARLIVRSPGGSIECRVGGESAAPSVTMTLEIGRWSVVKVPDGLGDLLGVPLADVPVARVDSGLDHLIVAVSDAAALSSIALDHDRWRAFGRRNGVDTIGVLAIQDDGVVHLRDVCAPIGDTEEAASGTTASAVTWHLNRLGRGDEFEIHQGVDMGRPSLLRTAMCGAAVEVTGNVVPVLT
ncbi:MAG: PhzF family phenazine biosynthesis protein [Ilumatobacter sp.]|nr:PhzF family phenazine biosynthesis protein [Ilumatobacter sp.]